MRASPSERKAFIVVCACLAIGGLGFRVAMVQLNVFLQKEPVPLRASLDELPGTLGDWKQYGKDQQFSDELIEELGTKNFLMRSYAYQGDPAKGLFQVHIAYYTGMIDTVPHIPERCWGANGLIMQGQPEIRKQNIDVSQWDYKNGPVQPGTGLRYPQATVKEPVTRKEVTVNLPLGDLTLTATCFQDPKFPEVTFIGGYFFIANGAITPSALAVRNLSFKLTDRYAYYCKVQFSYRAHEKPDVAITMFDQLSSDLLKSLLPQLMRNLPDWSALENQITHSSTKSP